MNLTPAYLIIIIAFLLNACGGPQVQQETIKLQPLEEFKALEIITSTLGAKGYQLAPPTTVTLSNQKSFVADITVLNESIAIEYITKQDLQEKGVMPDSAPGSRLHVIPVNVTLPDNTEKSMYILILENKDYMYHAVPTPEMRAPVTYHEIENRLKRDLNDYIAWYENTKKQ